jgi:hypothetical protein
MYLRIL